MCIRDSVVAGRVEPREILSLTVMFNHDIIDGGPATRFTRRLVELVECGYGLDEAAAATGVRLSANEDPLAQSSRPQPAAAEFA